MSAIHVKNFSMKAAAAMAVFLFVGLLMPAPSLSLPSDSCLAGSTKLSNGNILYFRLYVPKNFSTAKRYPLVMCLHGIGERGSDNRAQIDRENMSHQWMLDSVKTKYQPFTLYPQCPANDEWTNWNTASGGLPLGYSAPSAVGAVKIIDSLCKVYPIDTTRLYVGGLSWGGMGTEGIMVTYTNKFAASFPCAAENRIMADSIFKKIPFWIWHGSKDPTVDPKPDSDLVNTMIKGGTDVVRYFTDMSTGAPKTYSITDDSLAKKIASGSKYLYTDVVDAGHNPAWNQCFVHPLLVPFIMSKSKENGVSKFTWPAPGPKSIADGINRSPGQGRAKDISGWVRVTQGVVRWSGISLGLATLNIVSVNGILVKQMTIQGRNGERSCPELRSGIYLATLQSTQGPSAVKNAIIMLSGN